MDTITKGDAQSIKKSYRKDFDIYSLGIILVEISRWKPAVSWQEARDNEDATSFRDALVEKESMELGFTMGEGYRNATIKCLKGDFDLSEGKTMELAFYLDVVRELEKCSA